MFPRGDPADEPPGTDDPKGSCPIAGPLPVPSTSFIPGALYTSFGSASISLAGWASPANSSSPRAYGASWGRSLNRRASAAERLRLNQQGAGTEPHPPEEHDNAD